MLDRKSLSDALPDNGSAYYDTRTGTIRFTDDADSAAGDAAFTRRLIAAFAIGIAIDVALGFIVYKLMRFLW